MHMLMARTAAYVLLVMSVEAAWAQRSPADAVPFDISGFESEATQHLVDAGIIEGYPDGTAGARRVLTRYEFAQAWGRLLRKMRLQSSPVDWDAIRTDVPADHWAREAVELLAETGILRPSPYRDVSPWHWAADGVANASGIPDESTLWLTIDGNQPLLRREFTQVFANTWQLAAEQESLPAARTEGARDLGLPAGTPLAMAVNETILIGYPNGSFGLERPMVRIEAFFAMARVLIALEPRRHHKRP